MNNPPACKLHKLYGFIRTRTLMRYPILENWAPLEVSGPFKTCMSAPEPCTDRAGEGCLTRSGMSFGLDFKFKLQQPYPWTLPACQIPESLGQPQPQTLRPDKLRAQMHEPRLPVTTCTSTTLVQEAGPAQKTERP